MSKPPLPADRAQSHRAPSRIQRASIPGASTPPASSGNGLTLYVHVPFCVVKCGYCDFNSYVVDDEVAHDRFLDALAAELQSRGSTFRHGTRPHSVFFGGGTPSLLSEQRLERLFAIVGEAVDLQECAEVTIEANPESFTEAKARIARAGGVNRVSIGVQTFHAEYLQALDRAHDAAAAERAFAGARAAGFDNVSLDLMFAIPGETLPQWQSDLERALALRPDHLSCYNLTFEPGTRFTRDREQGRIKPNDERSDRVMFEWTRERLAKEGYEAYEVSNFAGSGGPCRHNDHYWLQGDYVGIGPGASSHRSGFRSTNLKPLDAWANAALCSPTCTGSAETLHPMQRIAEALWLGVRRTRGVDFAVVSKRIGAPAAEERFEPVIADHERRGLIAREGARIRLVGEGLLLADQVGGDYLACAIDA